METIAPALPGCCYRDRRHHLLARNRQNRIRRTASPRELSRSFYTVFINIFYLLEEELLENPGSQLLVARIGGHAVSIIDIATFPNIDGVAIWRLCPVHGSRRCGLPGETDRPHGAVPDPVYHFNDSDSTGSI